MKLQKIKRVAILLLFSFIFLLACNKVDTQKNQIEYSDNFSVHFLDVGGGECIYIRFPNGENMLIDTGNSRYYSFIKECLDIYSVNCIDYLVLTHIDSDHVGNAVNLFSDYTVKRVYTPFIYNLSLFPFFDEIVKSIPTDTQVITSTVYTYLKKGGVTFAFLSPELKDKNDGAYQQFNRTLEPTESLINNLSPYIYLEYNGVRFLFTGDADNVAEERFLQNKDVILYLYDSVLDVKIDLDGIDFYKVANHGKSSSNGEDFLSCFSPKNFIVFSGENLFPSTSTLLRFEKFNGYKLYRTDYCGTISVFVDSNKNVTVRQAVENV